MFTQANEECIGYVLSRAPTARITRNQAMQMNESIKK